MQDSEQELEIGVDKLYTAAGIGAQETGALYT